MSTPLSQLPQLAFTAVEAARMLGFITAEQIDDPIAARKGQRRVYELVKAQKLRARRLGKAYIISGQEIEAFLSGADDPIRHPDSVAS